jgi:hypothetical protein
MALDGTRVSIVDASPVGMFQGLLKAQDSVAGFLRQHDQRQLTQYVVKPKKSARSGVSPGMLTLPRVLFMVNPGHARLTQGFAMQPMKQRPGPRIHVPGLHFFEFQQPSVAEHPTSAGNNDDQAWGNRAVLKQPVFDGLSRP